MKTKDLLKICTVALAFPFFVTACDNSENDDTTPVTPVSTGLYILNSGNQSSSIEGTLSYLDYKTSTMSHKLFSTANGRSLGMTAESAVVYGSKMYILVTKSNTIEVVDKKTCKSIKQIQPTAAQGSMPRHSIVYGGKVYITMFDGYVSRIDTTSLSIDATIKVGPNPEDAILSNKYMYVANSDGNNWKNGYVNGQSVSKINLSTFTEEKKIAVGLNPGYFCADSNGDIFVLARGNYGTVTSKVQKIDKNDKVTDFADGTMFTSKDNTIYIINAPYKSTNNTYISYNATTGAKISDNFVATKVDYPCGISIDPVSGRYSLHLTILSVAKPAIIPTGM